MTPRGSYRAALESHLQANAHALRPGPASGWGSWVRDRNPLMTFVGICGGLRRSGRWRWVRRRSTCCGVPAVRRRSSRTPRTRVPRRRWRSRPTPRSSDSLDTWATSRPPNSPRRSAPRKRRCWRPFMRELPKLADAVAGAEVDGNPSFDASTTTGAAEAVGEAVDATKQAARKTSATTKRTARQARKVPGVAQVEGQVKGAVAARRISRSPATTRSRSRRSTAG